MWGVSNDNGKGNCRIKGACHDAIFNELNKQYRIFQFTFNDQARSRTEAGVVACVRETAKDSYIYMYICVLRISCALSVSVVSVAASASMS